MGGATAGSLMLKLKDGDSEISSIVLSINNNCNLACKHCYLGNSYGDIKYIDDSAIKKLFTKDFLHLAIVAKEPLLDKKSRGILKNIALECKKRDIYFGFITNGLNLHLLDGEVFNSCDYIDVSLHSLTYPNDLICHNIVVNLERYSSLYPGKFNVLTVLTEENNDEFKDIIKTIRDMPIKHFIVSPFLNTDRIEPYNLNFYSIEKFLEKLSESKEFLELDNSLALIDSYHAYFDAVNLNKIESIIKIFGIESKVKLYKTDPLKMGMVRVNYDQTVVHPLDALNTKSYNQIAAINISNIESYRILNDN